MTYPDDVVLVFPEQADDSRSDGGYAVRIAIEDGELWATIEAAYSGDASQGVHLIPADARKLGSALMAIADQLEGTR